MVRNTPSVTSLRDNMAGLDVSTSPEERMNSNYQVLPRTAEPMTPAQLAHFHREVRQGMLRQQMAQYQQNDHPRMPPVPAPQSQPTQMPPVYQANQAPQVPTPSMPPMNSTMTIPELQAHQMQLMLLEQQNKRRLDQARAENAREQEAHISPPQSQLPMPSPPSMTSTMTNHALQDYQMQLMLREQQDRRKREQDRADSNVREQEAHKAPPQSDQRRSVLASIEKRDMGYGTANSRWEHDHTRLLVKPLEECTVQEHAQIEVMWKAYLATQAERRRSKSHTAVMGETQRFTQATRENAAKYAKPFCDFLTNNPTVFHAVSAIKKQLKDAGWTELSERDAWNIKPSGKYFVERNGSSMIAFSVGGGYKPGNGAAILAGHVDALTAKLKPISQVPNKAGYVQLGIAPYAGAPNTTWWDRDLGIGGRVLVKQGDKIVSKLVKLDWPIARIPTLAPHFGAPAYGPFNPETQMVPIIGLEGTSSHDNEIQTAEPFSQPPLLGGAHGPVGGFVNTQPPKLVNAIAKELGLGVSMASTIVNWELELYDVQPATLGGLDKEFIYAGRIDDKLCSWAAIQALVESQDTASDNSSIIKVVGLFDDEEIGSLLRQGARGNLLPQTIERAVSSLADDRLTPDLIGRTYANSFLVSSDVTHAVNPNFLGSYLENHSPHLNVGVVVSADSNGHMTTDSVSTALLKRCADKVGANLQVFQIRNDSRSGGTVGPMLSAATGIRAIDAGIPQLSMHSIRATTGALDPGLGVLMFMGFLNGFEEVDKEFRD